MNNRYLVRLAYAHWLIGAMRRVTRPTPNACTSFNTS